VIFCFVAVKWCCSKCRTIECSATLFQLCNNGRV